jgi:hypothetical protein
MVKLFALRTKTHFDIPKTVSVSELSEGHTEELIETGELSYFEIALVFDHTAAKNWQRHKVHNLRENQSSGVHMYPPPGFYRIIDTGRDMFSSRLWSFLLFIFSKTISYALLSFA